MAALIHKMPFFSEFINEEDRKLIFHNSVRIFNTYYDFSDKGDLLRALILVSCL
jgi:hypothetical protein